MAVSVFDLFTIGIGPSSSHTVGPMRAARRFARRLDAAGDTTRTRRLAVELYGSLAATGRGHGTDRAVLMGLEGERPQTVDTSSIPARTEAIASSHSLRLLGRTPVPFVVERDLVFNRKALPYHPNGLRFTAYDAADEVLAQRVYYSVGGGFVVGEAIAAKGRIVEDTSEHPLPFRSGGELLALCATHDLDIAGVMLRNEQVWRDEAEVRAELLAIADAMRTSIRNGCAAHGLLPGGLKVRRRAPALWRELDKHAPDRPSDPLDALDHVAVYAIAVNEENAAGGRVVTAPTNGAAGIVPAVLEYYRTFRSDADDAGVVSFLLTAGAIAALFKENASISGAEVGCQGEVGVACSMAAAGLAAVLGGTPAQVENAAEIGMEHNLGLTCDPVGGLVQIPCIERNAMGATKAVMAARLALKGDGSHKVSLDRVIETMRQTGRDMKTKYKETARGGLAINVIEC